MKSQLSAISRQYTESRMLLADSCTFKIIRNMHYLLIYNLAPDYLERRGEFRDEHLNLAWESHENKKLVLGGALQDPADQAYLLFEDDSPESAQEFAKNDPYVKNGIVESWEVRPWMTVVGKDASNPVK